MRYAKNKEEGEEMVNNGFLKVFAKLDLYDSSQPFEAWFRTIMIRTCIDYFRKHSPKVDFVDVEEQYNLEYSESLIDNLDAEYILELVQKLPPAYRTVFSLNAIEGYSHAEIAEMLQIQEGTSRSNLAKARQKLQEWIIKLNIETLTRKDDGIF